MNFGTWSMRSLNWSGTLKTVDKELAKFRSDLLGIQEVFIRVVIPVVCNKLIRLECMFLFNTIYFIRW